MKAFVQRVVPTVDIKKNNVSDIQDEDFEKITSEIEAISRIIEEKDEAWKKERRKYEEERMMKETQFQKRYKEVQEELQKEKL